MAAANMGYITVTSSIVYVQSVLQAREYFTLKAPLKEPSCCCSLKHKQEVTTFIASMCKWINVDVIGLINVFIHKKNLNVAGFPRQEELSSAALRSAGRVVAQCCADGHGSVRCCSHGPTVT